MTNKLIKLPLREVLKNSLVFVWQHKKIVLPILPLVLILMIAQIVIRISPNCTADIQACSESWQLAILSILFSLTNIAIVINYCRTACGEKTSDYSSWSFIKKAGIYAALLLIVSLVLILAIAIIVALAIVVAHDTLIVQTIFYIGIIALGILTAPLLLIFPAAAMGDYEFMSIQRLFRLAKGNHNAIFWGLVSTSLICFLPMFILLGIAIWLQGLETMREQLWLMLSGMIMQIIYSMVKGVYYARIYQFFKYAEKNSK